MNTFHYAIIPAAGHSQRMGRHKLLLPWKSSTIIEQVLAAWTSSRVSRVVVVARGSDRELQVICRRADVDLVLPDIDPPDMKISVQHALTHIQRKCRLDFAELLPWWTCKAPRSRRLILAHPRRSGPGVFSANKRGGRNAPAAPFDFLCCIAPD